MNEFTAKKLGEVLAFAEVGMETFEKGRPALISTLSEVTVDNVIFGSQLHIDSIKKMAEDAGVLDIVMKKLEGTGMKLRAMRDLYVGDQWDNPTELLEWSGFFEGAAVVHWALVRGCGEATSNKDLTALAESGGELHQKILRLSEVLLHEVGKSKSTL
ncbi:MAG: hypothetical protein ACYCZW_00210 [Minisyncoccota bacterium]